MRKPVLVIMAAGMGSRYGGMKQIDPVDEYGHIIMDFSIFDAAEAGFSEVVFVIKRSIEEDFKRVIGNRISEHMKVHYVFQDNHDLPEGYRLPAGRVKPWGTAHAVLSCIYTLCDAPFAVINADDYYGAHAFSMIYDFLSTHTDDAKYHYAMVGYRLGNTLTEHGYVARGVCGINADGYLDTITERTRIEKREEGAAYYDADRDVWVPIDTKTTVSMNLWGFSASFLDELQSRFPKFLESACRKDPQKAEYFLPSVVDELLREDRADVRVMTSEDRWYGVTYKEDKPVVEAAVRKLKSDGAYPEKLW